MDHIGVAEDVTVEIVRSTNITNSVQISIVIPTFNRVAVLMEALLAIQMQSFTDFEVIIVDNGPSDDGTKQQVLGLLQDDARIIYISLAEKNLEKARNIGCLHARGNIVLLTDDDWELTDPQSLEYVVNCFQQDDFLGVLGISADYSSVNLSPLSWKTRIRQLLDRFYKPGKINRWGRVTARFYALPAGQRYDVDHVRGCCLAFRRDVGKDVGLFPSLYVYKGIGHRSETEFCCRVARKGYKVVFSSEIVGTHKSSYRPDYIMPRTLTPEKMKHLARAHLLFVLRNYWSPMTASLFILLDILVGNSSQPGLIRLFISYRYFGNIWFVLASIQGKWQGVTEYYRKYHNVNIRI